MKDLLILPVEAALEAGMALLKEEDTRLAAASALLTRMKLGQIHQEGGESVVSRILRAISRYVGYHPAIIDQVLDTLGVASQPSEIIEMIPTLLVGAVDAVICRVVEAFKNLVNEDVTLLVPVLGAVFDLPLNGRLRKEALRLCRDALAVVNEEDVPVVIRTLLKNLDEHCDLSILSEIRSECTSLTAATSSLLVEVLAAALLINPHCPRLFLLSIRSSETLTSLDLVVLLLLFSNTQARRPNQEILLHFLTIDRFPFTSLLTLCNNTTDNHWASSIALPLLELSKWLLLNSPKSPLLSAPSTQYIRCQASEVLRRLFRIHPFLRDQILGFFLMLCVPSNQATDDDTDPDLALSDFGCKLLHSLAMESASLLLPYSGILCDQILNNVAGLSYPNLRLLLQTLCILSKQPSSGLEATLIIYIHKQLLSWNTSALPSCSKPTSTSHSPFIASLILAEFLLLPQESCEGVSGSNAEDMSNVLESVRRSLQNGPPKVRPHCLVFLTHLVRHLDQKSTSFPSHELYKILHSLLIDTKVLSLSPKPSGYYSLEGHHHVEFQGKKKRKTSGLEKMVQVILDTEEEGAGGLRLSINIPALLKLQSEQGEKVGGDLIEFIQRLFEFLVEVGVGMCEVRKEKMELARFFCTGSFTLPDWPMEEGEWGVDVRFWRGEGNGCGTGARGKGWRESVVQAGICAMIASMISKVFSGLCLEQDEESAKLLKLQWAKQLDLAGRARMCLKVGKNRESGGEGGTMVGGTREGYKRRTGAWKWEEEEHLRILREMVEKRRVENEEGLGWIAKVLEMVGAELERGEDIKTFILLAGTILAEVEEEQAGMADITGSDRMRLVECILKQVPKLLELQRQLRRSEEKESREGLGECSSRDIEVNIDVEDISGLLSFNLRLLIDIIRQARHYDMMERNESLDETLDVGSSSSTDAPREEKELGVPMIAVARAIDRVRRRREEKELDTEEDYLVMEGAYQYLVGLSKDCEDEEIAGLLLEAMVLLTLGTHRAVSGSAEVAREQLKTIYPLLGTGGLFDSPVVPAALTYLVQKNTGAQGLQSSILKDIHRFASSRTSLIAQHSSSLRHVLLTYWSLLPRASRPSAMAQLLVHLMSESEAGKNSSGNKRSKISSALNGTGFCSKFSRIDIEACMAVVEAILLLGLGTLVLARPNVDTSALELRPYSEIEESMILLRCAISFAVKGRDAKGGFLKRVTEAGLKTCVKALGIIQWQVDRCLNWRCERGDEEEGKSVEHVKSLIEESLKFASISMEFCEEMRSYACKRLEERIGQGRYREEQGEEEEEEEEEEVLTRQGAKGGWEESKKIIPQLVLGYENLVEYIRDVSGILKLSIDGWSACHLPETNEGEDKKRLQQIAREAEAAGQGKENRGQEWNSGIVQEQDNDGDYAMRYEEDEEEEACSFEGFGVVSFRNKKRQEGWGGFGIEEEEGEADENSGDEEGKTLVVSYKAIKKRKVTST